MKKSETKSSAVIQLLEIVYGNSLESTGHSWERLNTAMRRALSIAIGAGFKFEDGDWSHIFSNFRSGYWLGSDVENWYTKCVSASNVSATASFEKAKVRDRREKRGRRFTTH